MLTMQFRCIMVRTRKSKIPPRFSLEDENVPEPETDSNEEVQQPAKFYHRPEDYSKNCTFMIRCNISKVLDNLEMYLSDMELDWFKDENQFKHLFHMPREKNRKLMGMWMLLLRTACLKRRKEWWFVVNGVPVRYSIREHALISGLNCKEYPKDGDNIGSFDFVERQFKRKNKIFLADVEKKLQTMPACEDRLHMAVLYLLGSIIKMKAKVPSAIEPFILRIVDDLEECKSYPWGRFTFEHCSLEIHKMLMSLNGEVKEKKSFTFPAFIIPLELLAFEAVDALKVMYREDCISSQGCPRMCQKRFKDTGMTGYPITDINDTVGETKEICSILEPTADEKRLLECIWDENFPEDYPDAVAEGMTAHLNAGGSIFWENLYERDVSARVEKGVDVEAEEAEEAEEVEEVEGQPSNVQRVNPINVPPPRDIFRELKKLMDDGFSHSRNMMKVIDEKVSLIGERVNVLECDVKNLQNVVHAGMGSREADGDTEVGDAAHHSPPHHSPAPQPSPPHHHSPPHHSCPAPQPSPYHSPAPQPSPTHHSPAPRPSPAHPHSPAHPSCPAPQPSPAHPHSAAHPSCPAPQPSPAHPSSPPQPSSPAHPYSPNIVPSEFSILRCGPVSGPLPFGSTEPLKPFFTRTKMKARKSVRACEPSKFLKSPFTEEKNRKKKQRKA